MTRAGLTKRRCRRIVGSGAREYAVEVRGDALIIRPLRTRSGGPAEIAVKWESIYIQAFLPKRRRAR